MHKNILLAAVAVTLAGSGAALIAAEQAPPRPMSFFVASTVPGSGNLGGLAGADAICQNLAQAAGAGAKTWHAYLSTQPANGQHGDNQRDRNNIQKMNNLTEKGETVRGFGDMPNEHDIMTGSDSTGRAFPAGFDTTCNNWTSDSTSNRAMLGHSDRMGGQNVSWNSAHLSRDCTKAGLIATGGAGRIYCFATN
jgi:hypothetical protein